MSDYFSIQKNDDGYGVLSLESIRPLIKYCMPNNCFFFMSINFFMKYSLHLIKEIL